jgi:hypothetical protein
MPVEPHHGRTLSGAGGVARREHHPHCDSLEEKPGPSVEKNIAEHFDPVYGIMERLGGDLDRGSNAADRPSEPMCPYCQGILVDQPKRKKKCPLCGNLIYVRTSPSTRKRRLVTKDEASRIDEEWNRLSYRKEWLGRLQQFGVTKGDFDIRKRQLAEKLGKNVRDRDVIWSLFNTSVTRIRDYGSLRTLYYNMALFVDEEVRDSFPFLQESAKMTLMMFGRRGRRRRVQISTAREKSCDACRRLEGQRITIERALKTMPIPNRNCAFHLSNEQWSFCRCSYVPVVD